MEIVEITVHIVVVIIIVCLIIRCISGGDDDYEECNPEECLGAKKVTFDEFLRLFNNNARCVELHPRYVVYCGDVIATIKNGKLPHRSFRLSFSYDDWKKYIKWYNKREQEIRNAIIEEQLNSNN